MQEVEAGMPPEEAKKAKEKWVQLIMQGKEHWVKSVADSTIGKRKSYIGEKYYAGPYEKKYPVEDGEMDWTKSGVDIYRKDGKKMGRGYMMQAKTNTLTKKKVKNDYWYGITTGDFLVNKDNPYGIFMSQKLSKDLAKSTKFMNQATGRATV